MGPRLLLLFLAMIGLISALNRHTHCKNYCKRVGHPEADCNEWCRMGGACEIRRSCYKEFKRLGWTPEKCVWKCQNFPARCHIKWDKY